MDFVLYYREELTVESVKAHVRSIGFVVPLCHARICLAEHIVHIYCDERPCFDPHVRVRTDLSRESRKTREMKMRPTLTGNRPATLSPPPT